jgi:FAD-linked sulfhydryl oxidase
MARRSHLTLTVALAVAIFITISYLFSSPAPQQVAPLRHDEPAAPLRHAPEDSRSDFKPAESKSEFSVDMDTIPAGILDGESIAPKLENATLKAELGHATWRFLHTMMARFPDDPTPDQRQTLETFMHLFGRLYPCGDCARHFREMLAEYPPQTSSRNAAAGWLCFLHNIVNERLEKPTFDCNNIGDFYDCGCGDEDKKKAEEEAKAAEVKA